MNSKVRIHAFWLAFALLASGDLLGADATNPARQWTLDESEIRRMLEASAQAFNRGDLAGHVAIYDESVRVMTKSGPRPGIAPIEKTFRESYFHEGKPKQQLRIEELTVRPLAADVALTTAKFVLTGGAEENRMGWFTLVWVRTPAGWRAVHDHSS